MKSSLKVFAVMMSVLMLMFVPSAFALDYGTTVKNTGDPCQNPNVEKSSYLVSTTTTTLLQSITAGTNKNVYICYISATAGSGISTIQLVSGTTVTTACDTGQTNLTPNMAMPVNGFLHTGYGGMITKTTTTSKAICTSTTGTVQGIVTYVKQ